MPASTASALDAPTGFAGEAHNKFEQTTSGSSALLALGIVYGDLGTSPLYTLQPVIRIMGDQFNAEAALGSLSLIIWALIITISIKYCLFVMRADNHGEGGILALMTLTGARWSGRGRWLVVAGLFGAALIYGDGIITPAISVLSAVEGLNVATDIFAPYTMPIAVVILVCLFAIQSRGTGTVGKAFGPVMMVWFATIGGLGIIGIVHHPQVLEALNPLHAARLLTTHGFIGFTVLGGIFLALTGGEALYADIGHIGRNPIRKAWLVRASVARPELCWANRHLHRYARSGGKSVFQACAQLGNLSLGGARDIGDHHRKSGHYHRVVFDDTTSDAARMVSRSSH